MKRTLCLLSAVILLLAVMAVPLAHATADTAATTTLPLTTTTTGYDCISTTTTWPPTTTTINLTGPDGTAPEYGESTATTTTSGDPAGELDLLTTAHVGTGDTVSVLAGPHADYGFCADCYSSDGGVIAIAPQNGYAFPLSYYRYLHMTVNTTMPFTVMLIDTQNAVNSGTSLWFGAAMNSDNSLIAKGPYVAVIDLHAAYEAYLGTVPSTATIAKIELQLSGAGSVSVGHLALSNNAVCAELPPAIQTTTFPSFPWWNDSTTTETTTTLNLTGPDGTAPTTYLTTTTGFITTTRPTTNPTVGDVLRPGDMDDDGMVSTADARIVLQCAIGAVTLDADHAVLADIDSDGDITTADAREVLKMSL